MHILLLAAIAFVSIAPAKAALYTYTPDAITDRGDQHLSISDLAFTLKISDAASTIGAFNYAYLSGPTGPLRQGDVTDFQSFAVPAFLISVQGTSAGSYQLDISLSFDASGQVSNGFLYYEDDAHRVIVNGSSESFSGTFSIGPFGAVNDVSGSLFSQVAVSEPSTLGVLGIVLSIAALGRLAPQLARAGWPADNDS